MYEVFQFEMWHSCTKGFPDVVWTMLGYGLFDKIKKSGESVRIQFSV